MRLDEWPKHARTSHRAADGARGLLGWSQSELAERSGLSLPTVKRVESGTGPRVSDEARAKLQRALEVAGIEFIDENGGGLGVRFRRPTPAQVGFAFYRGRCRRGLYLRIRVPCKLGRSAEFSCWIDMADLSAARDV